MYRTNACLFACDRFVRNGSTFVRMLAAGSIQMCSYVVSSELPPLSAKLAPPLPPSFINAAGKKEYACVSMAAGEISLVASDMFSLGFCMFLYFSS